MSNTFQSHNAVAMHLARLAQTTKPDKKKSYYKYVAIAMLLFDGEATPRIVLHRSADNFMNFVVGKIEDESTDEAAARIFYNKTGLQISFSMSAQSASSASAIQVQLIDHYKLQDTIFMVVKKVSVPRINTDAWKQSAVASKETTGVYAVKAGNIMEYSGNPTTYLRHGGSAYPHGTLVRRCALESMRLLQKLLKDCKWDY